MIFVSRNQYVEVFHRVFMYCRWISNYKEGRVETALTSLALPHYCVCLKPRLGYPTSFVVFSMFNRWRERWLLNLVGVLCRLSFHNMIKIKTNIYTLCSIYSSDLGGDHNHIVQYTSIYKISAYYTKGDFCTRSMWWSVAIIA